MSLQDAAIAANRFGLGARPGELKAIAGDPRGWLKAQLAPETALPAPLAALPDTQDDLTAFRRWIVASGLIRSVGAYGDALKPGAPHPAEGMAAMSRQAPGPAPADEPAEPGAYLSGEPRVLKVDDPGFTVEKSFIAWFGPRYVQAVKARIDVATTTERPFFERLVHFWGNHFTVSSAKPETQAMPPSFERDVARRHAVGSFHDMLRASTQHPGMLIYLDNYVSVGPNSLLVRHPMLMPAAFRERLKGLNENLAREILELHTLGVRSGYTQEDVTTFAKVITGWTVKPEGHAGGETGLFNFVDALHEPGPKTVLGQGYGQDGVAQGEAVLSALAHHPATSRFIAAKLVRHFVADDPPPRAVEAIATTFRQSGGDLSAVSAALVDLPEAWAPAPGKVKPPEDYLVSTVRGLGGPKLTGVQLTALFSRMGQRPYFAAGPNGWSDIGADWIGPDPVWKRLEFASAVGQGMASAGLNPLSVGDDILGPQMTHATRDAIARAESPAQGLALLLVSPEFQRR
ncbi:DUF1800 domain-containing protein [Caulobacter sp. KR2-114]|uniref:DUF1800 domain-containing protein n=1 Tax=Caulobacter sp. KR2-114 TaxID=3400912 RepID=UPI003C0C860B